MGDLENGMFSGEDIKNNPNDPTITFQWLTAIVKGKPGHWAIRAGDAQTGSLATYYDGGRPHDTTGKVTTHYDPMSKEGAIVLGSGGDNSNGAIGTFFEGAMTTGYPSNATEDAIQANVVAARYGKSAVTCTQAPPMPVNLEATPASSYQLDLSWSPVTPQATCWVFYNLYRDGTLLAGNLTTTSYTDAGLTPATAYQYYVQAVDSAGASAHSAITSITTGAATAISINVGGPALGNFLPDGYSTGGLTYTNSATITPPAGVPAEIFNTERYGNANDTNGAFTYSFQGFTAGSEWTVTLYFSETYLTAAGQRFFEVDINRRPVLAEWDLYAAAGGVNIGVSRSFPVTVDTDGKIVIDFLAGSVQNAKVNAIAITAGLPPRDVQAPTAPGTPTASNVTSTTATLTWTASTDDVGVAGYDIYSGPTLVGSSLRTSADVGNLAANTSYTFVVKAKDAAGNVSDPSVEVSVTTTSP
jgi:chitodextrinase